jgi:tetratricopeptide (TPR) repeat protein
MPLFRDSFLLQDLSYFLLIYIVLGLTFGAGFTFGLNRLLKSQKNFAAAAIIAGVILSGLGLGYNFKANDESKEFVVEDITVNTLKELEPNSVLMTYDWGYVYPAAIYYQQAEKLRGDVKVFNIKFLSVPWYLDMIKKYYPDVYENCKTEINEYINTYDNGNMHAMRLNNLVRAFINKNYGHFSVYMTFDFAYSKEIKPLISDYLVQPAGLVYKLAARNSVYDSTAGVNSLQAVFRKYDPDTQEKEKMNISTAGVYYDSGEYHFKHKNYPLALKFLDKALEIRSNFKEAIYLKNLILKETK